MLENRTQPIRDIIVYADKVRTKNPELYQVGEDFVRKQCLMLKNVLTDSSLTLEQKAVQVAELWVDKGFHIQYQSLRAQNGKEDCGLTEPVSIAHFLLNKLGDLEFNSEESMYTGGSCDCPDCCPNAVIQNYIPELVGISIDQ